MYATACPSHIFEASNPCAPRVITPYITFLRLVIHVLLEYNYASDSYNLEFIGSTIFMVLLVLFIRAAFFLP